MIFLWDAVTAERKELMLLPKGSRSVSSLAISPDGTRLVASDMSNDFQVHLFDLTTHDKKGNCRWISSEKIDRTKIFYLGFGSDSSQFVSVGVQHCVFWNIQGDKLAPKKVPMSQIKTPPG